MVAALYLNFEFRLMKPEDPTQYREGFTNKVISERVINLAVLTEVDNEN